MFCWKHLLKKFGKIPKKTPVPELFLNKVAGFRPQNFAKFFRHVFHRTPIVAASDSKIIYSPIPRFFYALITKLVNDQMFFRAGRNFHIFRTQIVLLIMLPFLNNKTECLTWKYQETKISRFL